MKHLLAFLMMMIAAPALAANDTSVSLPIGTWLGAAIELLNQVALPLVTIMLGWAARMLPAAVSQYLVMLRAEQLLARAIGWGLARVRGAAEGKQLTVDVGNQVLAEALQYAVDHAPTLVEAMGGVGKLREKVIARLHVEADATTATAANGALVLAK